ncbi:hypothetical protein K491DRAFT_584123 [Lophiostoma macrostomum CBS 122681]|uniref:NTF2-like protein n=1 Tax=Lophiostoma macrostomum CBS 122681 TaxID=1314788 RepID=A0A6A6TWQ2_9PLEO|nr:hypothetical protein K491DRAFT_584123 [Lophiostoma macrostomum CBS 122681]
MSLSAKYQAFLAGPSSGALADDASLHYITTLVSIKTPTDIIKHFSTQDKVLKKKGEKVLNAIEGDNSLALDVEATIDFIAGGGAYLPGVDQEFVSDRLTTFPMVHMVHFDANHKITQIRLFWDQGSLLKQVGLIGSRARAWPIRDGKDQARLIASSAGATAQPSAPAAASRRSTAARGPDDVTISERPATANSSRSSRSSTLNAMNDPHASLSLFESRDVNQDSSRGSYPAAPRTQSAKPPPRDLSELFVSGDPGTPSPGDATSQRIPTKSGGGKNFRANRLFEEEEPAETPSRADGVKTNKLKYNHFEFGNGDEDATPKVRDARPTSSKSKHQSSWDFEDFVTPEKTKEKILGQQVRHFGWSDDEEGSPIRRPVVHKARPDADAHFEFEDDGTPEAQRQHRVPSKGQGHNKGLGLYQDHVTNSTSDDEGNTAHKGDVKRPLGDVTTAVRNENRSKDFGSQWEMNDDSPAAQKNGGAKHVTENQKKTLNTLGAQWAFSESPETSKKENRGIKTTGNGMGARKGTGSTWSIGGDEDYHAPSEGKSSRHRPQESKGLWDF